MRPKNYTEDITKLINNLTQQITYSPTPEEDIEHLDEYDEFISELLTEFRNDRVYVIDLPVAMIFHPEGLDRFVVGLNDPNIIDTPISRNIETSPQMMWSFERLKLGIREELAQNREVFIYSIAPFRYTIPESGEIEYRPYIRWSKIPLEIWYNDEIPYQTLNPFMTKRLIKKHKL